jgi:RHS repeat-associated protein
MSHGMIRFIATLFLACLSFMAQGVEEVIYHHNDALGSPIIATDQEGRVVWRKSYAPYGQPIGQTAPDEPGYTGKFEEPDLGIQNFGARWYDPRIGRFLAIDPAGFDPQNPQSFNRYAYANNNPYRYVDPDGRWAEDVVLGVRSVALGTASLGENIANGNWGSAAVDAVGIVGDVAAIATPGIPGGAGLAIRAAREGSDIAAKAVTNPIPDTLARVIPGKGSFPTLGPPGKSDVFVTAADDVAGLNAKQMAERLSISPADSFSVIKFPTPESGLASPINRLDSGFVGGGRTAGGAREFVIPNGPIPPGAKKEIVDP